MLSLKAPVLLKEDKALFKPAETKKVEVINRMWIDQGFAKQTNTIGNM